MKRVGVRLSVVVKERVISLLHAGNISVAIRGTLKWNLKSDSRWRFANFVATLSKS